MLNRRTNKGAGRLCIRLQVWGLVIVLLLHLMNPSCQVNNHINIWQVVIPAIKCRYIPGENAVGTRNFLVAAGQ